MKNKSNLNISFTESTQEFCDWQGTVTVSIDVLLNDKKVGYVYTLLSSSEKLDSKKSEWSVVFPIPTTHDPRDYAGKRAGNLESAKKMIIKDIEQKNSKELGNERG